MTPEEKRQLYTTLYGGWENVPNSLRLKIEQEEEDEKQELKEKRPKFELDKVEPKTTMVDPDYEVPDTSNISESITGAASTGGEATADVATEGAPNLKGYGTAMSMMSESMASVMNMVNTVINGPEKQENFYTTYATDALSRLDRMERSAGAIKEMGMADIELSERGQRGRNKLASRGIGTQRALDITTYGKGLGAKRDIEQDYQQTLMNIGAKGVDVSLDRDKTIMGAEERIADKYEMAKDAQASAISQNIVDIGQVGSNAGKQMNKERASELAWQIAGNSGKYGNYLDYIDYFTNY